MFFINNSRDELSLCTFCTDFWNCEGNIDNSREIKTMHTGKVQVHAKLSFFKIHFLRF